MPVKIVNVRDQFSGSQQYIKILVAGPPGAGKTLMGSTWPNVLYLDAEGGLLSVRDRDVRAAHIETLADLQEVKHMLDQKPEVRASLLGGVVDTVVIDTVDEIARIVMKERLVTERKDLMAMADWGVYGDHLRNMLRGFRNIAQLNVVFNVHLKDFTDQETGRVEHKPAIAGQVGDEIAGYVDEAFLMVANTVSDPRTGDPVVIRYLQTSPDRQHNWIKDRSGTLPLQFPVDFKTDHERMAKLIFGANRIEATAPAATVELVSAARPVDNPLVETVGKEVPTVPPLRKSKPGRRKTEPSVTNVALPEIPDPPADVAVPAPAEPEQTDIPAEPEAVSEKETEPGITPDEAPEPVDTAVRCADCSDEITNPDYVELSEARFGVKLCRTHFLERVKRK